MITKYTITNTAWTAISSAGEQGSCWLSEDGEDFSGTVDIRVINSATGTPTDADLTLAKRVYKPNGNTDVLSISADSASDIFYARAKNSGDQAALLVDVI